MKAYPYWWDTVPGIWTGPSGPDLQPRTESLEPIDRRRFDVVIVGAGYTGLSAARQLARAGVSVAVLDRGQVGSGASSRNAGQVLTGLKLDVGTLVSTYGEARARELFEISREAMASLERVVADDQIDCDLERTGHLQAAAKPSHLRAFREEQSLLARVFSHQVSIVEARDQSTELGARGYHGLLVDPQSAAINPAQYVQGLAGAATRAGAGHL